MVFVVKNLVEYRELLTVLAWKNVTLRYKQAYLGIAWAVVKPLTLMLIFTLVKSFVGIDSGNIPYPLLTFAALIPWIFFQESASEGVSSVVGNANLIKKIYFPREIFPITAVVTKLVELGINFIILAGLMIWFQFIPSMYMLWVPFIIFYTILAALSIAFAGAAFNVYYRDMGTALPVLLSLLMYAYPVIYPLQLVKDKLLEQQAAGEWSNLLYTLYTLNPMAGIIEAFQSVVLRNQSPDLTAMVPGIILVAILLPLSYAVFQTGGILFRGCYLNMPIIEVNHVTKEYQLGQLQSMKTTAFNQWRRLTGQPIEERAPFKALDDVNFSIETGEVVGIIGHNGAGKSTLLKLLANISNPSSGSIQVKGKVAPLIEVGAGLVGDLTGRENIYLNGAILGIAKAEIKRKFYDIVAFAELEEFIDTPIKCYSSGMQARL